MINRQPKTGALLLCILLIFVVSFINSDRTIAEDSTQSRWAKVDLIQFCGKTIGELISGLGDDYDNIDYLGDEGCVGGFQFVYDNVRLNLYPAEIQYRPRILLNEDLSIRCYPTPDYELVKQELIESIRVFVYIDSMHICGSTSSADSVYSRKSSDYAFNYPMYIGMTIDSVLENIGILPIDSTVGFLGYLDDDIKYTGCSFHFSNGFILSLSFDKVVLQPQGRTEIISDASYFLNERVRSIGVYLKCKAVDSLDIQ